MSDQAVTETMQEALAQQREALEGQLSQPLSNKISTSGKLFTLPSGESHPGPLRAVILDFVWFLAHYPDSWNPDDPGEPDCWAIGRDTPESGYLTAHHDVQTPHAVSCATCPNNQWASGKGNAKACKNGRRLALVPPDATDATAPATLYLSPTALSRFDLYVKGLTHLHQLLPVQVITEIGFDAKPTYPSLTFSFVEPHDNMEVMWELQRRAQEQLFKPLERHDIAQPSAGS